jgi:hypothetical protein
LVFLLGIAMPGRRRPILAGSSNLRRGGRHPKRQAMERQRTVRLFYLVITALLFVSLGLLEVVTARGVAVTP